MPKKRATSTTSKTSLKKKTATKKKSVAPKVSTKAASATKRSTKKSVKKKTTRRVTEKQLTRADLPPELIAQITSELRAELRSEIDFKVQTAIAREREYLASIAAPCRYRPYDEPESKADQRRKIPSQPERSSPQIKFVNEIPDEFVRIEEERKRRWRDLKPQYDRGIELMEKYGKKIMNIPGVTGLHVGFKRKNNAIIHPLQYSLRISVNKKRQKNDARIFRKLPDFIDGYPTDILEREFESLGDSIPTDSWIDGKEAISSNKTKFNATIVDPLCGGIPISARSTLNNWGTLGLVGQKADKSLYGLTCAHVIDAKNRSAGSQVVQPPSSAMGSPRIIGNAIESKRDKYVDATIVAINEGFAGEIGTMFDAEMESLRGVLLRNTTTYDFHDNKEAFLIGAASKSNNNAVGRLQTLNGHIRTTDNHLFYNQIIVEKYSATNEEIVVPGDSGSILLMKTPDSYTDNIYPVLGLVHSKTKNGAIVACPWTKIEEMTPDIQWIP